MRNITVVTGTRAEYGLLKNIMKAIDEDKDLKLQLLVTGMHLSPKYGMTKNDILEDGFTIDEECPILLDYNGKDKNAREISIAISEFIGAFNRLKPDIVLVLGDRYEAFAAATTAMAMNIPIAHIAGGEITEGAMDEQIRHSITKMAHIHFPGVEVYAENIRNMGEENWRVFNVGDSGIENIKLTKMMTPDELKESLGVEVTQDTILATYHPVTLEVDDVENQINNVIDALDKINKPMIITYPNSDNGGDKIISALDKFAERNSNVHLFKSLGSLRYLSVMKYCGVIVGNSSSALIEAPYLKKPVVNIGNRQQGRLMAENIIQTNYNSDDIYNGIKKAFSPEFNEFVKTVESLYGEGSTSEEIVKVLKNVELGEKLLKKKLSWS
ncbi:UDP-N-acetylglucosamine 2-epimerase [uncultured Clostridium sp.]|jgi:GDP/UDP-N,N'-diacetylbacillosamine 2-epimerase (hydrolysing)|uniref:UDP-N-acetylglucosamine 2-epimerase n=1 Tax=uncultured Clostridium sp. TaxID=59620 RepID=UPI00259881AA|nr:UDP-N-acetylglucosamine 2-epimerase [uncultured Clostridium sp.]